MTGVETRTSAPLRIGRDAGRMSPSLRGLYPIGEGAGYAGGIMSAALDGAETAIMMMAHYKSYTDLSETDTKELAEAVTKLGEPLSQMGVILDGK